MHTPLFFITLFLYFVATMGFIMHLVTQRRDAERAATWVLAGGFAIHTLSILLRWVDAGHVPLVVMRETLSFLAWAVIGGFLLLQFTSRIKGLGAFILPMATALMGWAASMSGEITPLPPALQSFWLPIHAAVCLLAYAIFFLSFALAVMYLIQERQIKRKRLQGLFRRLPSLEGLDSMGHRCIVTGFVLLTVGIFTGSVWAEQAWGSYWSWDPKETWSLITWFLYAAILHQRFAVGWRGRRAAYLTIFAFAALLFTFIGVNLFLPGAHSYATIS